MHHRVSCHVPGVPGVFSDAGVKNTRWSWLRRSLYVLMLLSLLYLATLFSWNIIDHNLLRCPFREQPPAPAAAADATRSPTTLAHIVFVTGASKTKWAKRRVCTSLWWRPGAMRGDVWLDEEPSGIWQTGTHPRRRTACGGRTRRGRKPAAAARMAQAVAEAYEIAEAEKRTGAGAGEARWLVMGDDDTVFFPENLAAVLDRYDHREMYTVFFPENVAHSYAMAFGGGGGYAVSFPAAAALSGIMNGWLDRYNELYGSDHRDTAHPTSASAHPSSPEPDQAPHIPLLELAVRLTFFPTDTAGSGFVHHLDRLSPIVPNSLRRPDAVRALVGASRRDPARTLNPSGSEDPNSKTELRPCWGYMVHLYLSAVSPHELRMPHRTFRAWSESPAGLFTVNTRPEATAPLPCQDRVAGEPNPTLGRRSRTVMEYVPELVSSGAYDDACFAASWRP
ncbi:LOW QUALITY PROTEIN: hypothetical protein GQ55_9G528000 [Panicum hallii var. hallii]|uniref:Uncharacterized protein n=1 Tax=Panicum hallii var. hallii TaxID=1504633 RepID=A0A2T7CEK2_9POAL|nr:LOW QUALITY PROTEIN: hypothetical protein GQ55_9G528000 [Panicum hallii var. hallii]